MKILVYAFIFTLGVLVMPALAEDAFDGTKPLICATLQAVNCAADEECEKGMPEAIGAPQFLRIDFAKKEIIGPKHTTQILSMDMSGEQITLQGFELGMGWTLALDRATGKTVITLTNRDEGIILFGVCTIP